MNTSLYVFSDSFHRLGVKAAPYSRLTGFSEMLSKDFLIWSCSSCWIKLWIIGPMNQILWERNPGIGMSKKPLLDHSVAKFQEHDLKLEP